jgi:hypothetical protein
VLGTATWLFFQARRGLKRQFETWWAETTDEFWAPREVVDGGNGAYSRVERGRAWSFWPNSNHPEAIVPLDLLQHACAGVVEFPTEAVRGERCSHYRLISSSRVGVWLDAEGRVRRISRHVDEGESAWSGSHWLRETIELWDFGHAPAVPNVEDELVSHVEDWGSGPPPPSPFETDTPFG